MRKWLQKVRKNQGYTQQQIACLAKIERSFYSQIETGKRDPSVTTAKKIAYILKFDWTRFFEMEDAVAEKQ